MNCLKGVWLSACLALAMGISVTACGDDGDEDPLEHAITCGVLGLSISEHLFRDPVNCEPDPSFLIDFGAACSQGQPSDEDILACLDAVWALETCPDSLPEECLNFSENFQFTAQ